ncbi:MAG: hypothetical protein KF729_06240 [Sandaracinaceae bacterium]|nr:hypothetical protein [Sandaracinaceae bacterium]
MRTAIGWAVGLALLGAAISPTAHAQRTAEAFLYDDEHDGAVRATVEMDPALAVGVGYVRAVDVSVGRFHRRLGVHLDATAIIGFSSWDFAGGVSMHLAEGAGFNALATIDLELKVVQNDVHTGVAYGYSAAVRPGWFDPAWYLALDVGLHGTIATTLVHRGAYRERFPNVADGTYVTDNLSFFLGGVVGFRIERVVLVGLRFAWRFPRTFETYAPYFQPYTIDVEVGARF